MKEGKNACIISSRAKKREKGKRRRAFPASSAPERPCLSRPGKPFSTFHSPNSCREGRKRKRGAMSSSYALQKKPAGMCVQGGKEKAIHLSAIDERKKERFDVGPWRFPRRKKRQFHPL